MSIRIVTDSACDLPDEIIDHYQVTVVPLSIRFGDEEYVDREELSVDEFWSRCARTDLLPSTAAPSPGRFEAAYRRLIDEGATGIVVINLSGALSATNQSAMLAAQAITEVDVRVIDSRQASLGFGNIVKICAQMADDGASIDEIEAAAHDLSARTHTFGAIDTLENLKKGGRIGGAKAFLATTLSIKPLITVVDGAVEQAGRQRTRTKALKHLVGLVKKDADQIDTLSIMGADCPDLDQFVAMVQPHYDGEILVSMMGPVIGAHTGAGAIAVTYTTR